MTTLEMIKEWEKGCSCAMDNPIECQECTLALIEAIKKNEIKLIYSTYVCDNSRLNVIPQIDFYRFNVGKSSVELKGTSNATELSNLDLQLERKKDE